MMPICFVRFYYLQRRIKKVTITVRTPYNKHNNSYVVAIIFTVRKKKMK